MNASSQKQSGAIAIIMIIGLSVFAFAILATVSVLATNEFKRSADSRDTEETYFAAETGINEALRQLTDSATPRTFCLGFDGVQADDDAVACAALAGAKITVAIEPHPGPNPEDRYKRVVRSEALDTTGKVRKLAIEARTNSFAGGLNFAAHAGDEGILMDNTSKIFGDVFSNGDILPIGGGDAGSVWPDDPSDDCKYPGNVSISGNHTMQRVRIETYEDPGIPDECTKRGNARANTIIGKNPGTPIAGHAYYDVHFNDPHDVFKAHGETCPALGSGATYCHHLEEPVPDPIDLPITDDLANPLSDAHIPTWIREINASPNPVITAPGCLPPIAIPGPAGSCRPGGLPMGNQKIVGDLYIGIGDTMRLTGSVYVTGKVHIDNGARVELDPSLESHSVNFIVDGTLRIDNNATFFGVAGHPETALNFIGRSTSMDTGPGNAAMYVKNGSNSIILTVPHGLLQIENGNFLNVSMSKKMMLSNGTKVQFVPELANFSIPSPTPNPTGIIPGTWKEE